MAERIKRAKAPTGQRSRSSFHTKQSVDRLVLLSHKQALVGDWSACVAAELTGSFLLCLQMLMQLLANGEISGKEMGGPSQQFGRK